MPETAVREITFAQAVREALAEEMRRDSTVCIMGEDVAEAGTPFKVLSGLLEEFGKDRVLDTPISEAGFTGLAVGAAMTGLRPVVDIMFGDFITLTMDQMVNQAAKVHYMSGGKWKVPMVMRTTHGCERRSAAQHSQSLHAWYLPRSGIEGDSAFNALRCQRAAESCDSRRESSRLLRRQDDVQDEGPSTGGRLHHPAGCR